MIDAVQKLLDMSKGQEDLDFRAIRVDNSDLAIDDVRDIINMQESKRIIEGGEPVYSKGAKVFKFRGKRHRYVECTVEGVKKASTGDLVLVCTDVKKPVYANVDEILPIGRGCFTFSDEKSKRLVCNPQTTGVVDGVSLAPSKVSNRYLFLRADDADKIFELITASRRLFTIVRDRITGESRSVPFVEMNEILGSGQLPVDLYSDGDIVEIIDGAFKGEKARVRSVDSRKGLAEVEFITGQKSNVTFKFDKRQIKLIGQKEGM